MSPTTTTKNTNSATIHQTTPYTITPTHTQPDITQQLLNTNMATPTIHQTSIKQHPRPIQYPPRNTHNQLNTHQVTPKTHPTSTKPHLHISFVNLNHCPWWSGEVHSKVIGVFGILYPSPTMKTLTLTSLFITKTSYTTVTLTFWPSHQDYIGYCTNQLPVTVSIAIATTL